MKALLPCLFLFGLSASPGFAQWDTGNPLAGLEKLKDFTSARVSSSDPDWHNGNGDCRWIKPGGTLTLAELTGPGQIVHIWCTVAHSDPFYSRMLTLRIYWDGEQDPSVESPLGDFFGMGNGVDRPFDSLPVRVTSEGRGRNCYWPMPFRKSARLVLSNESDKPCDAFYYYIDWQRLPAMPTNSAYFHAKYRQEYPCVMGRNYLIADLSGQGHYVGTVQSVYLVSPGWYGEGDDFFFIDGESEPSLRGTGTEDYFCDGWCFPREQAGPFYGVPMFEGFDTGARATAYRWHIPDPIPFKRSLRLEIEHKGAQEFPDGTSTGFIERDDLMSSVAFWYQVEPHKPWPPLPPGAARLPFHEWIVLKGYTAVGSSRHSEDPVEVQALNGVTDGKQLWFRPQDDKGWIEVPFEVQTNLNAELTAKMVHSYDYGIYKVLLDGKPVAQLDLFDPQITPTAEKLGLQALSAGTHVLRFECMGKAPKSNGYLLGFDALVVRVPAYARSPKVDLRTLQKKS